MMRRLFVLLSITAFGVGINAAVAGGGGSIGTMTVDPTSGAPGTTVTVTVDNCGESGTNGVGISPSALPVFLIGTGQLQITVDGWGDAFNPFVGGTNDENGVATATFEVPNVAAGPYTISGQCVNFCATSSGNDVAACSTDVGAQNFGPYADGSFTVEAVPTDPVTPAAPAVEAQATTTG